MPKGKVLVLIAGGRVASNYANNLDSVVIRAGSIDESVDVRVEEVEVEITARVTRAD